MQTDYDILIIGGGLVGASLACALRAGDFRVGVVEAAPFPAMAQPSYDERTLALAYGSKRIFEGIGLWNEIFPHTTPIEHIHVSDRGRFGITRLSASEAGLPALGYVVTNRVLGATLLSTLQASPNVDAMCPADMQDIRIDAGAATVTLRVNDEERTRTARLVIAADGAHSAVRTALGIAADRIDYGQNAVVTTVTAATPQPHTAYERFTDAGPLALLPQAGDRYSVVWSANAAETQSIVGWSDAEFLARLQDRFGERLGTFTRPGRRTAYPLALTRVREHVRARLGLIGNAAHTVHPVAGQGFNLGLRDVAAIAEILTDAARAGEDIGDLAVLRRYADWRARDNRVTAGFTNGLIRIFSNNAFPLTLARNAGLLAADLLPVVKRNFVRVTSGLAGRLPRLARGLTLD